jgi:hypothetical protein
MLVQARVLQNFLDFVMILLVQKPRQHRVDDDGVSRLDQIELGRELIWVGTWPIVGLLFQVLVLAISSQESGIHSASIHIPEPIRNLLDYHVLRFHDGLDAFALFAHYLHLLGHSRRGIILDSLRGPLLDPLPFLVQQHLMQILILARADHGSGRVLQIVDRRRKPAKFQLLVNLVQNFGRELLFLFALYFFLRSHRGHTVVSFMAVGANLRYTN